MINDFYRGFNQIAQDSWFAEQDAWTFNNKSYPAVNVEELDFTTRAALAGGPMAQATLIIEALADVLTLSGVKKGAYITARDKKLKVIHIGDDGSSSHTLYCESAASGAKL